MTLIDAVSDKAVAAQVQQEQLLLAAAEVAAAVPAPSQDCAEERAEFAAIALHYREINGTELKDFARISTGNVGRFFSRADVPLNHQAALLRLRQAMRDWEKKQEDTRREEERARREASRSRRRRKEEDETPPELPPLVFEPKADIPPTRWKELGSQVVALLLKAELPGIPGIARVSWTAQEGRIRLLMPRHPGVCLSDETHTAVYFLEDLCTTRVIKRCRQGCADEVLEEGREHRPWTPVVPERKKPTPRSRPERRSRRSSRERGSRRGSRERGDERRDESKGDSSSSSKNSRSSRQDRDPAERVREIMDKEKSRQAAREAASRAKADEKERAAQAKAEEKERAKREKEENKKRERKEREERERQEQEEREAQEAAERRKKAAKAAEPSWDAPEDEGADTGLFGNSAFNTVGDDAVGDGGGLFGLGADDDMFSSGGGESWIYCFLSFGSRAGSPWLSLRLTRSHHMHFNSRNQSTCYDRRAVW